MAKPSILFIIHAYENRGGTEEHAKTLAEGILDHYNPVFLYPQTKGTTGIVLQEMHQKRFIPCELPSFPFTSFRHPQTEKILNDVVIEIKPKIIHIQHWLYWHTGLIEQTASYKIPVILSLHDYYLFSPEFTLSSGNINQSISPAYAMKVFGHDCSKYLEERQRLHIQSIQRIDRIIVPSVFLENLIAPFRYPQTIEHGIRPFDIKHKNKGTEQKIGYIGSFLPQKGKETLLALGKLWASHHPEKFIHIFGSSGEALGLKFHGPYDQDMRAQVFGEIDILIIPSLFNETYSLILSEGWHAGCYPVVSNLGALGERVKSGVTGETFQAGNSEALFSILEQLNQKGINPSFVPPEVRLADEMVRDYLLLYSELLR